MSDAKAKFCVELLGPFRLFGPDGRRIELASKRGQAMIAMLATSNGGERTRTWLQSQLWGSRQQPQAQASLRRELSNLRQSINQGEQELVLADHGRVWIDLALADIDLRRQETAHKGEFLEGLDIAGEDAFEEWLREQRRAIEAGLSFDGTGQARLPQRIVDMTAPVPGFRGQPAIAILPLENLTGNPELDYFGDGFSEDLIDRLSRLKWVPVIARSASFRYRGKPIEICDIGETLGARYIVEGRIRNSDQSIHVTLSMSVAETAVSVWTRSVELPVPFTRAIIDDLIVEIVAVIDSRIDAAETSRASLKSDADLTADDLIWRGRWHLNRYTKDDSNSAERCFTEALRLSPNSPEALVQMTFFRGRSIWSERKDEKKIREFRQLSQRAIAADSEDGRGYMYAGMAEMWMRRTDKAISLFLRSITFNPSLALAHAQIGSAHILAGNPEAAMAPLKMALRLGPNEEYTFYVLGELAIAHCMLGQWDEAIDHADQALLRRVAYWYAHGSKITALVNKGSHVEAEFAARQLLEAKPDFSPEHVDWLPFVDNKWNIFIKAGLRMAGVT
jgi:TolB-like protein